MADLFDNPMGLMGFEFVEFASPAPNVLEPLFEKMGFTLVARHRSKDVLLYRQGAEVRAWLNVCPHAGRRLDWAPGKFLKSKDGLLVCAAHGASFELQRGDCVAGPCRGDSLRAVPVRVTEGMVRLA